VTLCNAAIQTLGVSKSSRAAIKAQGMQHGTSSEKGQDLLGCLTGAMPTIMDTREAYQSIYDFEFVAVGSTPDQWWHGKPPRQVRQCLIGNNQVPLMASENRESKRLCASMKR